MIRRSRPRGDLLRNQRKYRYRRPNTSRKWIFLLLICATIFGIAKFFFTDDDLEFHSEFDGVSQEAMLLVSEAVYQAAGQVGADTSLDNTLNTAPGNPRAATAPKSAQQREIQPDAAALTASWQEGQPVFIAGKLQKNESISLSLQQRGIPYQAIHNVVTATSELFDFRKSRPGDSWTADVAADGTITRFRYQASAEDVFITTRDADGKYTCTKEEVAVESRTEAIGGTIDNTFWQALEATGEQGLMAFRFMEIFQYTIDFNTETRVGDQFALVVEKTYLDGKFLRYGRLLAAKYVGPTGTHYAFFHDNKDNKSDRGYFDASGDNLQRQFLRSPLPVTRITSRFGRRVHPVLGGHRDHQGVDYGAPTGTPVQAVADGVITHAGWKGANGNLVAIRHSGGYETYYAHLSSVTSALKNGKRVSRGDLIGKVGSTGRSTGPHLHFGMKKNGTYVDPLTVDATRGDPLRGSELQRFKNNIVNPLQSQLEAVLKTNASKPAMVEVVH